jgi:hypothetical protein
MLAEKWRQNRWAVSSDDDRDLLKSMGIQAAAAPAAAPVPPNVQQNMNLIRPQAVPTGAGGSTVAIIPGEGQEDQGTLKRHTIEPELPNAKYHMMGALVTAEEHRLMADAGLPLGSGEIDPEAEANPEMFTEEERSNWEKHPCQQCGQTKPDVTWQEWDEFGDINDPTKPMTGWFCEDCALELAQDI